jgi:hypothetical protein
MRSRVAPCSRVSSLLMFRHSSFRFHRSFAICHRNSSRPSRHTLDILVIISSFCNTLVTCVKISSLLVMLSFTLHHEQTFRSNHLYHARPLHAAVGPDDAAFQGLTLVLSGSTYPVSVGYVSWLQSQKGSG